MSDSTVEMYTVEADRPATRFQVNRVNSDCKDKKEIYRKINESDDEEGNTFPENTEKIVIRRQSRYVLERCS